MLRFSVASSLDSHAAGDVLVVPFYQGEHAPRAAASMEAVLPAALLPPIQRGDFLGKSGEVSVVYCDAVREGRILLLGLGNEDKLDAESARRAFSSASRWCMKQKWVHLTVMAPLWDGVKLEAMLEGLWLPNYIFQGYKSGGDPKERALEEIQFVTDHPDFASHFKEARVLHEAVNLVRDLVNRSADEVTPSYLAATALKMGETLPLVQVETHGKEWITEQGMGLLLAVGRGSAVDPMFIVAKYRGGEEGAPHLVLIGKGVTYDTGGLNLKPTGGMETMKCDMAGGATCLAALRAVARLSIPINLTVVVPATENSIDGKSFKPGDVYRSYSGKTVEMTNSDAEGRLILADAVSYAVRHLRPDLLIDVATLTGAIEVALGSEATGMMSTSDLLAQRLYELGERLGERVWRMPLYADYQERLKSEIADLKSWNGRSASSSVAASFLRAFVPTDLPWAHLDIAGTAYLAEPKHYLPKHGTGTGVRLLVKFCASLVTRPLLGKREQSGVGS